MKRLLALLLSVIFVATLSACGVKDMIGGNNGDLQNPNSNINPPSGSETDANFTADEAVDIALKDAGLKREEVRMIESHLDYDNGVLVYEIDFDRDAHEYSYEINAKTGVIVDRDKDIED